MHDVKRRARRSGAGANPGSP